MMIHTYHDSTKCRTHCTSEKMEEEGGGFRTVECLRGRLLAERQASRTAREEAELMCIKITELEVHLEEEIKLRERAEKRLGFLMKMLESLKGLRNTDGSEQWSSSDVSCESSSAATSVPKDELDKEGKIRFANLEKTRDDSDLGDDTKPDQVTVNGSSMEEKSSSGLGDLSSGEPSGVASTASHEESRPGDSR
ncbi:PREDICTED: uncharacterized protein LOC104805339 [Tarenaya hassleriana]|uniref:uncharacterized protein LOC104805339 n=1 Tax=Tarenaya hassleriana TaxID=28532 RepID=UPI00053C364C|nr:PREDICTED: uncharacterized protein LOC104805339 [Tarenaya hassleriana]